MRKRQRQRTKNRLARARLNCYCRETNTSWPSCEFLESFEADVRSLTATNRVTWKTLQRLDERLPSLRIALRIDNVANRAIAVRILHGILCRQIDIVEAGFPAP